MNIIESTLFAILRSALGFEKLTSPVSLSPRQWTKLYEVSLQQQVAALVYDELKAVGNSMSRVWQAYSEFSSRRFDAQLMALTRLSAILESENIRMMVLKGIGIALTYPKPQLREFGDIDIFCFDDYDRLNDLVVSSGLDTNARETEEKHFGFEINGIEVENHRKFCSESNRANIYVGKVLMKMTAQEPSQDDRLPGILFPSAQMGALHLIMHTLSHLAWSGITLRHLCDVTMFLKQHSSEIDSVQLHSVFKEAGMEKSAAMLLSLCNNFLSLGLDISDWEQYGPNVSETVLNSIFHPFKNSCYTRDPLRKFCRKVVMHRFRARLYHIVYGEKYPEKFLESFVCLKKEP